MNAASAAPTQGFGSTARLIGGVIILILSGVALYYMYDYLFNITSIQTKAAIVSGPISSNAGTTGFQYPKSGDSDTKLNQYIFTGGETSVSFWMYVTGAGTSLTNKKHILHLGTLEDGTDIPTLLVALGGKNNGLFVQVNDGRTPNGSGVTTSGIHSYMMDAADPANDVTKACNVANIEYGRWVNVVIVLNNTLCDVYMDGKLARSSVLKGQFQVGATPKFYLLKPSFSTGGITVNTDWNGSLSNVNFYNYAVSPDEVYRLYMAGPSGASGNLWDYIKSFFGSMNVTTPVTTT